MSLSWGEAAKLVFDNLGDIGALSEAVGKTYEQVMRIRDDLKQRGHQSRISGLALRMSGVNAYKIEAKTMLHRYLADPTVYFGWDGVLAQLEIVSSELSKLRQEVEANAASVLAVAGVPHLSQLSAALSQQARFYAQMSTLAAPVTDAEKQTAAGLADQLDRLLDDVLKLEGEIASYAALGRAAG